MSTPNIINVTDSIMQTGQMFYSEHQYNPKYKMGLMVQFNAQYDTNYTNGVYTKLPVKDPSNNRTTIYFNIWMSYFYTNTTKTSADTRNLTVQVSRYDVNKGSDVTPLIYNNSWSQSHGSNSSGAALLSRESVTVPHNADGSCVVHIHVQYNRTTSPGPLICDSYIRLEPYASQIPEAPKEFTISDIMYFDSNDQANPYKQLYSERFDLFNSNSAIKVKATDINYFVTLRSSFTALSGSTYYEHLTKNKISDLLNAPVSGVHAVRIGSSDEYYIKNISYNFNNSTFLAWVTGNPNTINFGGIQFSIYTYSGSSTSQTLIGSNTCARKISLALPPTTQFEPKVAQNGVVFIEDDNCIKYSKDGVNLYLKGESRFKASVTGVLCYNSPLKIGTDGFKIRIPSDASEDFIPSDTIIRKDLSIDFIYTIPKNYSENTISMKAAVIDKRSRQSPFLDSGNIYDVIDYNKPVISKLSVKRGIISNGVFIEDLDHGDNIQITFSSEVNPITYNGSNLNDPVYKIYYKRTSDNTFENLNVSFEQNENKYNVENKSVVIQNADLNSSYDVQVTVEDYFYNGNNFISKKTKVSTAHFIMHLHRSGKGVAFGKISETADIADFGYTTKFSSNVYGNAYGLGSYPQSCRILNSNLNDYIETGNYFVRAIADASNISNIPAIIAGKLIVENVNGNDNIDNDNIYLRQTFIPYTFSFPIYERYIYITQSGSSNIIFGPWCSILSSTTLYESIPAPLGDNTNINESHVLSENPGRFRYLELFYTDNNAMDISSTKVCLNVFGSNLDINGKTFSLSITEAGNNGTTYLRRSKYRIVNNNEVYSIDLINNNTNYGYIRIESNGNIVVNTSKNFIQIYRIDGIR